MFARSRLTVEVLTRYLKDMVRDPLGNAGRVRGYRGGYLPTQRREIARELRAAITSHQVGDSVEIQIVRNGDKMTLNAVLEAIPEE